MCDSDSSYSDESSRSDSDSDSEDEPPVLPSKNSDERRKRAHMNALWMRQTTVDIEKELRKEISQQTQKVNDCQKSLMRSRRINKRLHEVVRASEKKIGELEKDVDIWKMQLRKVGKGALDTENELRDCRANYEHCRIEIKTLKSQNESQKSEIASLEKKNQELNEFATDLEKEEIEWRKREDDFLREKERLEKENSQLLKQLSLAVRKKTDIDEENEKEQLRDPIDLQDSENDQTPHIVQKQPTGGDISLLSPLRHSILFEFDDDDDEVEVEVGEK